MLSDAEQKVVEAMLATVDDLRLNLLTIKAEVDESLHTTETLREALTKLLPPEKRLEKLFH